MPQDYVGSFSAAKGTEVLHYGVKGMKWGQRNAKDHSSSTSHVKREGTGLKRGLVTDFTVSPYRSAGRIRSGRKTFEQLTPKQQNKLHKSLARDMGKTLEKKLPKDMRGKTDYLATVKSNPKLRDSLVRQHGTLLKFGKRDAANENKRQYLTTLSNWPRVIGWGQKTFNAGPIGALALRKFSKHDALDNPEYVGATLNAFEDLEHFGVKGMKWGVRRSSSSSGGKATPTRARRKEVESAAKTKEAAKLNDRIERIKSGTGRPLVINGKVLSRGESVKMLERQAAKLGVKPPAKPKKADDDPDAPPSDAVKYAELKAKAKEKGPSSLTDDELKFVNARTEALNKTKNLIAEPDSWLKATVKTAVRTAVKKKIDDAATSGADYLKEYLIAKANGKKTKPSGPFKVNPAAVGSRPGGKRKNSVVRSTTPIYKVTTL